MGLWTRHTTADPPSHRRTDRPTDAPTDRPTHRASYRRTHRHCFDVMLLAWCHLMHRSHFGSRYTLGCCMYASLFSYPVHLTAMREAQQVKKIVRERAGEREREMPRCLAAWLAGWLAAWLVATQSLGRLKGGLGWPFRCHTAHCHHRLLETLSCESARPNSLGIQSKSPA